MTLTLHSSVFLMILVLFSVQDAQGVVEITKFSITSNVSVRFAEVVVNSSVVNSGKNGEEISFEVQIPTRAFISRFSIFLNGEEFKGEVRENIEAQQIYIAAQQNNEATGLITQQARVLDNFDFELFNVKVFFPGESVAEFHLQYQELLERHLGVYSQRIYIRPQQIIPELNIFCFYHEPQGFRTFTYKLPKPDGRDVQTKFTDLTRTIMYTPSDVSQVAEDLDAGLASALLVEYDVIHESDGGIVVENENHFTHFFSPECQNELILNKRIVFVIDKSGSMESPRIDYVKTALRAILSQLRSTDYFNLITFDSAIFKWKPTLVEASPTNINRAIEFTNSIVANGPTNINTALLEGIQLFKNRPMRGTLTLESNVLVFLTDGLATHGVTNTIKIRELVSNANQNDGDRLAASIFSLAFGDGANTDFLKRLAWSNGGAYAAIRTDQDAGSLLLNFFQQVQDPYLNDIKFEYTVANEESGSISLTQNEFPQYFCGSELIVSGEFQETYYDTSNVAVPSTDEIQPKLNPRVLAKNNRTSVEFVASLRIKLAESDNAGFLSRLYVYKKIKDLLQQAEVATGFDSDLKAQLQAEALNLSLAYSLVTKLTSMVVRSVKAPERADPVQTINRIGIGSLTKNNQIRSDLSDLFADQSASDLSTPVELWERERNNALPNTPSLGVVVVLCLSLLLVIMF